MHLLEREVTIAEVLQQAGYGTAHFGKVAHRDDLRQTQEAVADAARF